MLFFSTTPITSTLTSTPSKTTHPSKYTYSPALTMTPIERKKASALAQLLRSSPPEPEIPRHTYHRSTLCSGCHKTYPSRFSDLCVDCEAEENPMYLYTIHESDEEDVEEEELDTPSLSPPSSPSPFHLDLSNIQPPRFAFEGYPSSNSSTTSTVLTDSILPSPYFEVPGDLYSPISTPGSFTTVMKECKGYIFEKHHNEPQDYFPVYITSSPTTTVGSAPGAHDPMALDDLTPTSGVAALEVKRSGPIRIPRSSTAERENIIADADAVLEMSGSPTTPRRMTGLRRTFTPRGD